MAEVGEGTGATPGAGEEEEDDEDEDEEAGGEEEEDSVEEGVEEVAVEVEVEEDGEEGEGEALLVEGDETGEGGGEEGEEGFFGEVEASVLGFLLLLLPLSGFLSGSRVRLPPGALRGFLLLGSSSRARSTSMGVSVRMGGAGVESPD